MRLEGRWWRAACVTVAAFVITGCSKQEQGWDQGPPPVEVVTVSSRAYTATRALPGRIEPVRSAEVRARVAGIVMKRSFEEGADVQAGDVLFEIDPRPLRAELSRAEGALARAQASVDDTQAVFKRYEPLVEIEAVSQQDFEAAKAAYQSATAERRSAQAEVEAARLNLGYSTVVAPISGRIGRALVTEGALVGQGEATPLAVIQQIDPVYADFQRPIAEAMRLRRTQASGEAASISISLEGEEEQRVGKLLFSDITVDRGTGQISLRGEFPNPDGLLLPGMYVRVHIADNGPRQAILIPQRAVRPAGEGRGHVVVVGDGDVAEAREVRVGEMVAGEWLILEGLNDNERIVINGAAVPGEPVTVQIPGEKPADEGAERARTTQ